MDGYPQGDDTIFEFDYFISLVRSVARVACVTRNFLKFHYYCNCKGSLSLSYCRHSQPTWNPDSMIRTAEASNTRTAIRAFQFHRCIGILYARRIAGLASTYPLLRYAATASKRNFPETSSTSIDVDAWNPELFVFGQNMAEKSESWRFLCVYTLGTRAVERVILEEGLRVAVSCLSRRFSVLDYSLEQASRLSLAAGTTGVSRVASPNGTAICRIINNTLQAAFDGRQTNSCAAACGPWN